MSAQAQNGTTVKVEFVGTLPNGTVFGRATSQDPLEFTLGKAEIIPGFEEAVVGMEPGQTKKATVPATKAFGTHDDRKCLQIERQQFPKDADPEVGRKVTVRQDDGKPLTGVVSAVADAGVTVDFNHPLAGQDLEFQIKLLEVR